MNLAEFSIQRKTTTMVMTVVMFVGGLFMFRSLGRLEDPEFTIKEAVVTTLYPGATPQEVSDRFHFHLKEAGVSLQEHRFLPTVEKGDKDSPAQALPVGIYLEKIRSAHNVGSILRTAEAFAL